MIKEKPRRESEDEIVIKILGTLSGIQSVRDCLQEDFEILRSSPCFENVGSPGYHTFLNIKLKESANHG